MRTKSVLGFPYRVVYYEDADELFVVAVAHDKRRPGYWSHRFAKR